MFKKRIKKEFPPLTEVIRTLHYNAFMEAGGKMPDPEELLIMAVGSVSINGVPYEVQVVLNPDSQTWLGGEIESQWQE
jgi:hypothetical protein